jgi:hypothetical protein
MEGLRSVIIPDARLEFCDTRSLSSSFPETVLRRLSKLTGVRKVCGSDVVTTIETSLDCSFIAEAVGQNADKEVQ